MTNDPAAPIEPRRPRVALLVNQISPYRRRLFARLAERLDLAILHGRMEHNRPWSQPSVEGAKTHCVAGWTLPYIKRGLVGARDQGYLHLEPGYIAELLRFRPDAIISGEIGFRTMIALAYGVLFRVPVWVWWGGTLHTERNANVARRGIRKLAARGVRHWISYGTTSTEYLLSLGVSRDRILQVQNCVDEAAYSTPASAAVSLNPRPVVLHVGRLIARKGILAFLHAIARCQQQGVEFSTLLVGSGPDELILKSQAEHLRLRNIHFLPDQPASAMPSFYRSADLLVFPTLGDVWGLVANEAMLSGLPVLCSKYAGCASELFDPDCIFDPANPEDFYLKLSSAVGGRIRPAPLSRLWTSTQVADCIADAVMSSAGFARRDHLSYVELS